MTLTELLSRFPNARRNGAGYKARCPAHDDNVASLSISESSGKLLLHCHAGCSIDDVLAAAGLVKVDLFANPASNGHTKPRIVAAYDYRDGDGTLLYQAIRYEPKDFRQRRPDGKGGWLWNLDNVPRVLYHLPELRQASSDDWVFVAEGEKDVDALARLGLVATSNVGGAGKWRDDYSQELTGRKVAILPDNDEPGRRHAEQVAASLHRVAAEVKIVTLPGLALKGDASDWLGLGGTRDELLELVEQAPTYEPGTVSHGTSVPTTEPAWPDPLDGAALHGLTGAIVRAIEPHTEADQAALLVQFLVAFGNAIGRSAFYPVEGDQHYVNENAILVGETAKGRKGTSWGQIHRLFALTEELNPDPLAGSWVKNRIMGGLSSGEGLIWAVRDPIYKIEPVKEKGKATGEYVQTMVDAGEADKRLLVIESEFASVLKVAAREGNTLSAIVRQAWDTGTLRTIVKNNPAKATGAHISILGHVTKTELLRFLDATESANGFANRFLWLCVRRSRCLPDGGSLSDSELQPLARRLQEAIDFASQAGEMRRDDEARAIWHAVYPDLSEGKPGLVGAVTSRAEAHVLRLSCLYALLDGSTIIRKEHLLAALAVWEYVEASCAYIFGDSLGDPDADIILRALKAATSGLSRTDISALFGRNRSATQIDRALSALREMGKVRCEKTSDTGGRPLEVWYAA